MSDILKFVDVWSIRDKDQLEFIPRPILALIVIFPDKDVAKAAIPSFRKSASMSELASGVLWFKQKIYNACGLYAILHAVCNGVAKDFIRLSRP